MADLVFKKLRRQMEREKRRAFYREMRQNQLLDMAYRGLNQEQNPLDLQLKNPQDWNRQIK